MEEGQLAPSAERAVETARWGTTARENVGDGHRARLLCAPWTSTAQDPACVRAFPPSSSVACEKHRLDIIRLLLPRTYVVPRKQMARAVSSPSKTYPHLVGVADALRQTVDARTPGVCFVILPTTDATDLSFPRSLPSIHSPSPPTPPSRVAVRAHVSAHVQ